MNREHIENFVLALNITGGLWWLSDPLILNWFDPTEIRTAEGIGSAYLASFTGDLQLEDFRAAAALVANIEKVYEMNESRNEFSAARVALDALDLAVRAGTTALCFIQNMIAVEALCSTSSFEVQHRVGTTCAVLLHSPLEDRRKLYDRVTYLYDARSRMIHGSGRKITKDELKIEQISRPLMRFVLADEVLPNYRTPKLQKKFLLDAVLG